MSDKQIQKAGDNSQQIQAQSVYITNGITEERVREICSEVAVRAIADNTIEANDVAMKRIDHLTDLLLPRIQSIEKDFESFSDPSFQILLKRAQLTAGCTERECDYEVIAELLAHRIKNKNNIKKKASILKAVEIIDQVDDDSLCALTMYHAVMTFVPVSGRIVDGIRVLSRLYEKINLNLLPENDLWLDNLTILGAISIIPFSKVRNYEEIITRLLDGYVCVGIKKDSDEYKQAIELLNKQGLSLDMLIDHELLEGYVRLAINQKSSIENLPLSVIIIIDGQPQIVNTTLSEEQKKCLYDIFELYTVDVQLMGTVKKKLNELLNSFESIAKVIVWWNSLSTNFRTTSIGKVIAHTNAKRIDDTLPDLDG